MSQRAKVKIRQQAGKDVWIPCGNCGQDTCHKILTSVELTDESEDGDIQVWEEYNAVQCVGCGAVTFCHDSRCSEDVTFENGEQELVLNRKLYPARIAGRLPLKSYELPFGIRKIYAEAHSAFSNSCPILAGVGLRAMWRLCAKRSLSLGEISRLKLTI